MAIETPVEIPSSNVTAAVLAGGGSTRFGSDKALATLPGEEVNFLERAVSVAHEVAGAVFVVAPDNPEYRVTGARILPDLFPGEGPAGGVLTALRGATTEWLLVLSCDQPFVESQDLAVLLAADMRATVTAFRSTGGGFHPLPCAIRIEPSLPVAEGAFAEGSRSLQELLRRCGVTTIPIRDPGHESRLRDIDSPTDVPGVELA